MGSRFIETSTRQKRCTSATISALVIAGRRQTAESSPVLREILPLAATAAGRVTEPTAGQLEGRSTHWMPKAECKSDHIFTTVRWLTEAILMEPSTGGES